MPRGPLGGPRPFTRDKKTILVLIGANGPAPPDDVQLSAQEVVNAIVNRALIERGAKISLERQTVNLTVSSNPTPEQREAVGPGILHVQQYDISTELEEVSQGLINAIHNTVVEEVENLGFEIEGTKTTVK